MLVTLKKITRKKEFDLHTILLKILKKLKTKYIKLLKKYKYLQKNIYIFLFIFSK